MGSPERRVGGEERRRAVQDARLSAVAVSPALKRNPWCPSGSPPRSLGLQTLSFLPPERPTALHLPQDVVVPRLEGDVEELAQLVQLSAGPGEGEWVGA